MSATLRRLFVLLGAAAPALARAQVCEPSKSSQEAKIFATRAVSFALSRSGAITADSVRTIRIGFEGATVPSISDEIARPTTCRPFKGPENVNAVSFFGRLRVAYALTNHVTVDAAWVPPVKLGGMQANLFSFALDARWPRQVYGLDVAARVHSTIGHLSGPITCDADAVKDITSECFQGDVSDDRLEPNIRGLDVTVGRTVHSPAFAWFAGAGYTQMKPRFHVHFVNANGTLDSTEVRVDLTRMALFGGASWTHSSGVRGSLELYTTPGDAVVVRALIDLAAWRPHF